MTEEKAKIIIRKMYENKKAVLSNSSFKISEVPLIEDQVDALKFALNKLENEEK